MRPPGLARVEVPTPFQIGTVNVYLLEGPPRTLIDVGPHSEEAQRALSGGLSALGLALEEVEQVLITHPHLDHFGLAGAVKARSGARVLAHPQAVEKLEDFSGFYRREQRFFREELVAWGADAQSAQLLTELPGSFAVLAPPVAVDATLSEGDELQVGPYRLEVVETPGHSPGSLCFYLAQERVLFAGDHLIQGITPNPLLEPPSPATGRRPRSLVEYVASLKKVAALELETVYSGHRAPITDPRRVIRENFEHVERRAARVLELLGERGPLTPFALMGLLFPHLPATEQFLGLSEAVGHLEWLVDQGRVRPRPGTSPLSYEPA